jgi:hypothetical protein
MSIPDPGYDEVEGVDLAILQAYDAYIEGQTDDDIYGIGIGQSREGIYANGERSCASSKTCIVTPEEQQIPETPPSDRRRSSVRQAPARLTSHIPPSNFGAVMPGSVYRSQFPLPENFSFMKTLKLKTILTLVPEPYPMPYLQFMDDSGIRQIRVHVPANKEIIKIEPATMVQALGVVLDRANYPLLVHCNKGKHRTGCVVACFRKVLGESLDSILHEYHTYAGHKARSLDEEFIKGFDERALLWLARENGFLHEDEPAAESPGVTGLKMPSRTRG